MKYSVTRRRYAALLGGAIGMCATALRAQPTEQKCIVGVLMGLANDEEARVRAKIIEQGLAKRGWVVGQNLRIEYRYANSDQGLMQRFAAELVDLNCDCIVGQSTPVVAALKNATQTIPIVFIAVARPDRQRLRRQLGAAGWERHRLHQSSANDYRQMFIYIERAEIETHPRRHHVQS